MGVLSAIFLAVRIGIGLGRADGENPQNDGKGCDGLHLRSPFPIVLYRRVAVGHQYRHNASLSGVKGETLRVFFCSSLAQ